MSTQATNEPSDLGTQRSSGRFRFDESLWWKWARRAFAGLLVAGLVAVWLVARTYGVLLLAPLAVVVASVLQRVLAVVQGRLHTGFITKPFNPENRPYLIQFALRAVLAVMVIAGASLAILRIEVATGPPAPERQWFGVAVPVVLFVLLQLIPSRPVSRSLNFVAVVVVVFLGFQLIQVHYRSSAVDAIAIAAPFQGEWFVSAGGRSSLVSLHYGPLFGDQWYAVDFLIERDGKTFEGDSSDLGSFHCWDQPILAPADGVVVVAEDGLQDWPIGHELTDSSQLAGNVVVIDIGGDRYVQLAHLRMGSIPVTVGQSVSAGEVVGRCGNSGNTDEPHLHMQVQDSPESLNELQSDAVQVELNTFPFRFTNAIHIRGGTEYPDQESQLRRNDRVRTENSP